MTCTTCCKVWPLCVIDLQGTLKAHYAESSHRRCSCCVTPVDYGDVMSQGKSLLTLLIATSTIKVYVLTAVWICLVKSCFFCTTQFKWTPDLVKWHFLSAWFRSNFTHADSVCSFFCAPCLCDVGLSMIAFSIFC